MNGMQCEPHTTTKWDSSNPAVSSPYRRDGNSVLLGVLNHLRAALQVPLPPGGNDLDVRLESVVGHLEADLVVTLTRGTVADSVSSNLYTYECVA